MFLWYTLLLSACASRTYEWIKVNPDRLKAYKSAPANGGLRTVSMKISLKEKAEQITYYENTADYINANPENIDFEQAVIPNKSKPKYLRRNKASNSSLEKKPLLKTSEPEFSVDKLNSSLRIPKKKSLKGSENNLASKTDKPPIAPLEIAPSPDVTTTVEDKTDNTSESKNEGLFNEDNEQTSDDFSSSNQVQEDDSLDPDQKSSGKKNSYMWVGLVLLIIGLIIGLIFGGMAYLISVAGIVFLAIGYFTGV